MEKIIKARRRNGFTMVSNVARMDTGISLKAFGLLTYVMGLPDGWEINVRQLQQAKTDGRDAVYSAINELIDKGYCQRRRIYDASNRFAGVEYVFSDEKLFDEPDTAKPDSDSPDTEFPYTGFPYPEKPYDINTVYSNTDSINTFSINKEDSAFLQKADFPTDEEVLEVEALPLGQDDSQEVSEQQQQKKQRAAAAKKNKAETSAKSSAKKTANQKTADPAHQLCVDAFDTRYKKHSGAKFIWQGKDLAAIKKLIPIIRNLWAEKKGCQPADISPEAVSKAMHVFCDRVEADAWLQKNYSPTGILSNINKIITTHGNGNQNAAATSSAKRSNNFGGFASKELLDQFLAITGTTSPHFDLDTELERLRKEYSAG